MKELAIVKSMSLVANRSMLKIRKHSPEILLVTGLVGIVSSAVMACKATTKASEIVDDMRNKREAIHECETNQKLVESGEYTEEDAKKDLTLVYFQTAVKFAKLYGPAILLGALSVASVLTSHNIMRKRNLALAAAYATVDKGFKEYRDRVIDRFGKEVDKQLKYNIKAEKIDEKTIDPETGEEKIEEKTVETGEIPEHSCYARFFDEYSDYWQRNAEYNLMFLRAQERYANDKLKARGHLFLNEVYDALGIPRTQAGQIVGWIYDPKSNTEGDNYVDFGIYNLYDRQKRKFVNGTEYSILLDFNVDGDIWSRI